MSSQVYEIIKTIYATTQDAVPNPISTESIDSAPRIKVLQSTLGQLRLNNIATLDALMTHYTRLIDLTSADETFVNALAQSLAPCILRPRTENALTMEERHAYRLIRDLFEHKEAIFGELKRQSSTLGGSNSLSHRQRAVSNADESSRRANMEARAKAISEQRQRDKSPAPTNRHRRDKSSDTSGRFPVVASPRPDAAKTGGGFTAPPEKRTSLEVPGSVETSPSQTRSESSRRQPSGQYEAYSALSNGHANDPNSPDVPTMFSSGGPGPHIPPPVEDSPIEPERPSSPGAGSVHDPVSTSGSLKRSSGSARKPVRGSGSLREASSLDHVDEKNKSEGTHGVQLVDRPMDDFS